MSEEKETSGEEKLSDLTPEEEVDAYLDKDLKIDADDLDGEATRQPALFAWWGRRWAKASREAKAAKANVEFVRASVGLNIRSEPSAVLGRDIKVTDAAIQAAISESDGCQEAEKRQIEARYISDLLTVAKDSMQMKKEMIRALIDERELEYFSGVGEGGARKIREKVRMRIAESRRKRAGKQDNV